MRRFAAIFIIAGMLLALPHRSVASVQQPTIESLNEEIAKAEAEIKRNEQLLGKIKKDQTTTQSELKLVRSRIANRQNIVTSLQQQLSILERQIRSKSSSIAGMEKEIDGLKKEYGDMVYAAYKNHKLNNSMAFVFASEDFNDATRRIDYMRRYNLMREAKARELDSLSRILAADIEGLDEERSKLDKTKSTRDKELKTLKTEETSYKKSSDKLAQDEKKVAGTIKQKEQERKKAQEQLRKMIAEQAKKAGAAKLTEAEERALIALSGRFDENQGKFAYPVNGGVIIDHFGIHKHPTQKELTIENRGVNIAAEKGAQVHSLFEGTVCQVGFIMGMNNVVMIQHGNYFTVYANLANVNVTPNQKVITNQVIGTLPATEDNNDYYLHFELWKETTYLNPEKWFR